MAMPKNWPRNRYRSWNSGESGPGVKVNIYFSSHSPLVQFLVGNSMGTKHLLAEVCVDADDEGDEVELRSSEGTEDEEMECRACSSAATCWKHSRYGPPASIEIQH